MNIDILYPNTLMYVRNDNILTIVSL
jgi:hypothetical protein